ncbi:hypothetical protein E4O03_03970 [Treponema sp. OMZ 792]|uniref:M23 family metallopeptidase n=1 Tax=unclassified Treponema TaxID=2638727 RepID=UPI0020A45C67|nr:MULTISPECIES: M23 family metallopeptidase [unclassified Treponema]UTC75880.1 hypothetical protein E4O03_03970 [Treponema sp. OMZ 792]UTC78316.1 M23 family metallopeptidase [Treponema sp. OMZ 799]UTC79880.1 M23 family metallopeptidase [Treponema sp. OMZ 798]
MKKNIYIFLFFMTFLYSYSFEWPVENPSLLRLFAQRDESSASVSRSLVFKEVETVRASGYGKHVISIEDKNSARFFPSTLGNAMIFIDDEGLQSVYGNLSETDIFVSRKETEAGSILGYAGKSAWTEEKSLIFQVADTRNNVLINPLLFMPAVEEKTEPQIQNTVLINGDKQIINLETSKKIRQGAYDLYSSIFDSAEKGGPPLAPFRIMVSINGMNIADLPFEVLSSDGKDLYLQNKKASLSLLYQKEGTMHLGKINLPAGKIELIITALDKSGNQKRASFVFQVE